MATPDQRKDNLQRAPGGPEQRSENLLPADSGDGDAAADDGRYEVAEEVNLDQQSDLARRVGKPPKGIASDALADTLKDERAGKQ
ncbi:hypothetical protein QPK32_12630 [Massilia sp. YIM B02763]|uniref:hypothetical protein n=1 Tax=Massilia sp. YIM B02763 TaxID=3050130 RepID=UPI0025B67AAA|nr:hypothetical protein [Massilia sp. YIM B02763]MDN4053925.1 hypothetical protein [Massilia sp. YIM B02763]